MKKALAIVAASAALLLTLTACGYTEPEPAPAPTAEVAETPETVETTEPVPVEETAEPEVPEDPEGMFLYYLNEDPYFADTPDADLLNAAYTTCVGVESFSVETILKTAQENGIPYESALLMVTTAIYTICPQHSILVDEYFEGM